MNDVEKTELMMKHLKYINDCQSAILENKLHFLDSDSRTEEERLEMQAFESSMKDQIIRSRQLIAGIV